MKIYLLALLSCLLLFACVDSPENVDATARDYATLQQTCELETGNECVDASYERVEDGTAQAKSCSACNSGYATCCEWLYINKTWVQNCVTNSCSCRKFGPIGWCEYTPLSD